MLKKDVYIDIYIEKHLFWMSSNIQILVTGSLIRSHMNTHRNSKYPLYIKTINYKNTIAHLWLDHQKERKTRYV